MNYKDLIDQLAEKTDQPKNRTKDFVEETFSALSDQLVKRNGVSIPNLGTFSIKVHDIRKIYSPHHKKFMMVPPKRVVEFSPSAVLKDELKFVEPDDE